MGLFFCKRAWEFEACSTNWPQPVGGSLSIVFYMLDDAYWCEARAPASGLWLEDAWN